MSKLIGVLPKNSREELRVTLDEFRGHNLANMRVWATKPDGAVIPTKAGLALRIQQLPEVIALLQKTERACREAGLLATEAA